MSLINGQSDSEVVYTVRNGASVMKCCAHVLVKYIRMLHFQYYSLTQNGASALFIASQAGQSDVVNILIRNGAIVNMAAQVRKMLLFGTAYCH